MKYHDFHYEQALTVLSVLSLTYGEDQDEDLLMISRISHHLKLQHPKTFNKVADKLIKMKLAT